MKGKRSVEGSSTDYLRRSNNTVSVSNTISLFEEKDRSCEMDNKEKAFVKFEDYRGFVFTSSDIRKLGPAELQKFYEGLKMKQIKFIAGTYTKMSDGRAVDKVVNKKRLLAMGLDLNDSYYQFVKGWRHPLDVQMEKVLEEKRKMRYMEVRVYADTIDRRVDEAESTKERKRIRKIDYELDDKRGWTKVKPGEHKRARRKAKKVDEWV